MINAQRQALVFDLVGQTLRYYPTDWALDVPSAASAKVYAGRDSIDQAEDFAPSVSIDSVNLTVSGASGWSQPDRRRLLLGDTTGLVVGEQYVLANARGQREVIEVAEIDPGNAVYSQQYLAYDYAIGDTCKGFRLSFVVDAAWIADEDNINLPNYPYKVLWEWTTAGVTRRAVTLVDIERIASQRRVMAKDVFDRWPDLRSQEWIEDHGEDFGDQIALAYRDVDADLRLIGLDPSKVSADELYDRLVVLRVGRIIARAGITPGNRDSDLWVEETRAEYSEELTKARNFFTTTNDEGAIQPSPPPQVLIER